MTSFPGASHYHWATREDECEQDYSLVNCPCCDGAGEWDEGPLPASSGATEPDYRQVVCPECEGSGKVFVDTEPRTLDDMDEEYRA